MPRFWRAAISAALVCAVSFSAWASCLPGQMTDKGDMACCQKMSNCEQAMKAADCCQAPATSAQRFVAVTPAPVVKPLAKVSFGFELHDLTVPARSRAMAFGRSPVVASSPPIFLLDTSLRI